MLFRSQDVIAEAEDAIDTAPDADARTDGETPADAAQESGPDEAADLAADPAVDPSPDPAADPGIDAAGDLPRGFVIHVAESLGALSTGTTGTPWSFVAVSNPPADEMPQKVTAQAGDCLFLEPIATGTCDTFCAWPGYCGEDDACHEGLPRRWAGDIALSGLQAECSLPIDTSTPYPYYSGACTPEDPANLFEEGVTITATSAGCDDLPAFALETRGVESMVSRLPCTGFALVRDQGLHVTWTPGGQDGDRVRFRLISGNHGTQFGHIECETGDTGNLDVDATLVNLHLDAFNPMPTWSLERVHAGDAVIDGTRVVLEASSQVRCGYVIR